MKLLVWNILQGGGRRRDAIADCILSHAPDVIALVEFVPATGEALLKRLREAGFIHQRRAHREGARYAVCVLSKSPVHSVPSGIPLLDDSGLWLEVAVPAAGCSLGVVHAPTTPRTRMRDFLSALVQLAANRAPGSFIFTGDFNTGAGAADGPLKNYGDVDRFGAVCEAGFVDAWRHLHMEESEHTWTRAGSAYRIDHALLSAPLLPRLRACRYSHEERLARVSDHSILLLELHPPLLPTPFSLRSPEIQ